MDSAENVVKSKRLFDKVVSIFGKWSISSLAKMVDVDTDDKYIRNDDRPIITKKETISNEKGASQRIEYT